MIRKLFIGLVICLLSFSMIGSVSATYVYDDCPEIPSPDWDWDIHIKSIHNSQPVSRVWEDKVVKDDSAGLCICDHMSPRIPDHHEIPLEGEDILCNVVCGHNERVPHEGHLA